MDTIFYATQENTFILVAVTAFVGGLIGSGIKYVFEHYLPVHSQRKQAALDNFEWYRNKLLRTSASLISSLNLYMRYLNENSLPLEEDEHSKMTLLYAFSSFFGWNK